MNEPTAVDTLQVPYREAEKRGIEVPQLKYPEGEGTVWCTCAYFEAPKDRPAKLCPCHGWEIHGREDFPATDSAQEARERRA